MVRPIGGFFGLGIADVPPCPNSVWDRWTRDGLPATAWTARSLFARLIESIQPRRVWIPAFMCRDVVAVAPQGALRLYRLDQALSPDVSDLRQNIKSGDLVFTTNYFGWPPGDEFLGLVCERPDVVWLEDRAHCLWTGRPAWGSYLLYSPRKLFGVSDGGVLICRNDIKISDVTGDSSEARFVLPEIMRFEDEFEVDNSNWHAAFKAREAELSAEPRPMSRVTAAMLRRIPIDPLIEARQRNFAYLERELGEYRLLPSPAACVTPFGFVIKVADAEKLGAALARERLFCSRHWPPSALAVPAAEFPTEHQLARSIITLPCDHRYDETSLARLAEAVRRLAPMA